MIKQAENHDVNCSVGGWSYKPGGLPCLLYCYNSSLPELFKHFNMPPSKMYLSTETCLRYRCLVTQKKHIAGTESQGGQYSGVTLSTPPDSTRTSTGNKAFLYCK